MAEELAEVHAELRALRSMVEATDRLVIECARALGLRHVVTEKLARRKRPNPPGFGD